jgi:hypothetical protein
MLFEARRTFNLNMEPLNACFHDQKHRGPTGESVLGRVGRFYSSRGLAPISYGWTVVNHSANLGLHLKSPNFCLLTVKLPSLKEIKEAQADVSSAGVAEWLMRGQSAGTRNSRSENQSARDLRVSWVRILPPALMTADVNPVSFQKGGSTFPISRTCGDGWDWRLWVQDSVVVNICFGPWSPPT